MASQTSTSSQSRSSAHSRMLLFSHGERPVLRTSGTKENPGHRFWGCVYFEVQQRYNFFHWADPEAEVEHLEIARMRRKVSPLKSRTKVAEWKLKVVTALGFIGWVGFVYLLLQKILKVRLPCIIPLNLWLNSVLESG